MSAVPRALRRLSGVRASLLEGKWEPVLAVGAQLVLAVVLVFGNVAGAAVVFVNAAWILPSPPIRDPAEVTLVNLVAAGAYLAVAIPVGAVWNSRGFGVALRAAREKRSPTPEERRAVLRGPVRVAWRLAALWMVAAVLFGILNLRYSGLLALKVILTVAAGGLTTCAVAYLLAERLLRPVMASVLRGEVPERPEVPGVAARAFLAWALGTGIGLIGLILVALFALTVGRVSARELAVTVLGLGGGALLVGVFTTVLAARAAADPIMSVRRALRRVEGGDLDAEVRVFDATEVGLLQAGFNRMVAGLREREQIREAFGTYVDRDVADHILEEGTALDGEEVEVTTMFLDIRDFTGFAAGRPAAETVARLNELFELVVPIVHRHEGHVDKFVGDGLLAVFGAPRRHSDHADRAVRAAIEIARRSAEELDQLEIGIGLNTGTVLAGNVGGAGRLEFSVIGDAVNVAARVEACTRQTEDPILIAQATKESLGGPDVQVEERPSVELKGKSEPVALYALRLD